MFNDMAKSKLYIWPGYILCRIFDASEDRLIDIAYCDAKFAHAIPNWLIHNTQRTDLPNHTNFTW